MKWRGILAGLSLLGMVGCIDGVVDHQFVSLPQSCWSWGDTLHYDLLPVKESGVYGWQVQLRLLPDFKYKSIWVVVDQEWQQSYKHLSDTLHIDLEILPQESLEKGIVLHHYASDVMPVHLRKGQKGAISIRHIMQEENLLSIKDVGFILAKPEKIESKNSEKLKIFL